MMDDAVGRPTLVENVNSAFSAQNIAISAARLAGLSPRADFLAISRRVGVLIRISGNFWTRVCR